MLGFVFPLLVVAAAAQPQVAMFRNYCTGCHNAKSAAGGVALDKELTSDVAERVVRKLRTRQMPPAGLPRPQEPVYEAVVASMTGTLDRAKADPGRTDTFRRLNRTEYRNAVRDLLDLDVDVSSLLPADESSHGFDNVTVGELSPTLLEKYLAAASKISRLAVGVPPNAAGGHTVFTKPDLTQEGQLDGLPLGSRGGVTTPYNFPADGEYEIQVRLWRDRDERVEGLLDPHELELALDGERLKLWGVRRPQGTEPHHLVDKDFNVRLAVKGGPHDITATFLKRSGALPESERQPYQARFNADRHPRAQPAVYSVSILGPYNASGPTQTPSQKRLLVCAEKTGACAKRILRTVLQRAYRRPVTEADLSQPMRFYSQGGLEMALRAVLTSPQFLFRIERDPAGVNGPYWISDLELATRLSFFLWSSIPDEALLAAAERKTLRQPGVLAQHVRRMLKDRRASALVDNFASQWLYLRNLDAVSPDPRQFPDFDDNLRQAFRRETEMLVDDVIRSDRSVLDLLRANYTFLNERLAKHYGIPGVYGNRFRRVDLDPSTHRGGLLSHGSVLTVTSYSTRTSPVIRGKWVLANILGTPPPPPPAQVPPLKERSATKAVTLRDRVAEHRANPACAGCHNLIDPVGFALENYDAVGRWRSQEEGVDVDATGQLPDGSRFDGAAQLQQAVLKRPENFVSTLAEKLLTYALGRGVENFDAPAVRRAVRESQTKDFRFSALVQAIVESTPFQMRRTS
ncbi:MAG: DUF1592 domain-containing protein [Acidobacteria bacterium]|nr:DUF1592 domain-containing protein [Acidobacteriota bacterium]